VARLVRSPDAERDLDSIFDYIARESSFARAEAVLRRIDRSMQLLASQPRMGRARPDLDGSRYLAAPPWLIVYQALGSDVVILRVVDGRRDLTELLGG
jgi:toxin ParE1/3/4